MTWRTRRDRIDKRTGQPVRYQQHPDKSVLPKGLQVVISPNIAKPTFEELKKSGWFLVPMDEIDPEIRGLVEKINELPYATTYGSCAGHTDAEWRARGMVPPSPEESHAYISCYVSGERRRDFLQQLKKYIDITGVDIHLEPVGFSKLFDPFFGGSQFERWYPTKDVVITKDKVFSVHISSKTLHLPLNGGG